MLNIVVNLQKHYSHYVQGYNIPYAERVLITIRSIQDITNIYVFQKFFRKEIIMMLEFYVSLQRDGDVFGLMQALICHDSFSCFNKHERNSFQIKESLLLFLLHEIRVM